MKYRFTNRYLSHSVLKPLIALFVLSSACLALSSCGKTPAKEAPAEDDPTPDYNIDFYQGAAIQRPSMYLSGFDAKRRDYLDHDFNFLSKILIKDEKAADLKRVMKIEDTTPQSLVRWLDERFKIFLDKDFNYNTQMNFRKKGVSAEKAYVMAANVGTAYYAYGKKNNFSIDFVVPSYSTVPVSSPRVGIIQEGEGLFHNGESKYSLKRLFFTMTRLSTLFHEARHSDGHDDSLGFFHMQCPAWHSYANLYACDDNTNGPYTVGTKFLYSFVDSCQRCDSKTRTILQIMAIDSDSRVIGSEDWDDAPEGQP